MAGIPPPCPGPAEIREPPMKKRGLAILIAALGVLCVVCGALLLQGNSAPVTAEPSPSSTVEATASPAPAETPELVSSRPETEEP